MQDSRQILAPDAPMRRSAIIYYRNQESIGSFVRDLAAAL